MAEKVGGVKGCGEEKVGCDGKGMRMDNVCKGKMLNSTKRGGMPVAPRCLGRGKEKGKTCEKR